MGRLTPEYRAVLSSVATARGLATYGHAGPLAVG